MRPTSTNPPVNIAQESLVTSGDVAHVTIAAEVEATVEIGGEDEGTIGVGGLKNLISEKDCL